MVVERTRERSVEASREPTRADASGASETMATVVSAWAAHDAEHALHPTDQDVICATEAVRWLVLERFVGPRGCPASGSVRTSERDLWSACARLGALTAEHGGSPSLAAIAIDGLVHALSTSGVPFDAGHVAAARASLVEGYVAGVRDAERSSAVARWEYPACSVPLAEDTVAVACGYPGDDGEALAGWAARIAKHLVKAKVRRVVLSGPDHVKGEVASAATLVGIEIVSAPLALRPPDSKAWFRLPWRK